MSDKVVCPRCRSKRRIMERKQRKGYCYLCEGKFMVTASLAAVYTLRFADQPIYRAETEQFLMKQFLREYYKNEI